MRLGEVAWSLRVLFNGSCPPRRVPSPCQGARVPVVTTPEVPACITFAYVHLRNDRTWIYVDRRTNTRWFRCRLDDSVRLSPEIGRVQPLGVTVYGLCYNGGSAVTLLVQTLTKSSSPVHFPDTLDATNPHTGLDFSSRSRCPADGSLPPPGCKIVGGGVFFASRIGTDAPPCARRCPYRWVHTVSRMVPPQHPRDERIGGRRRRRLAEDEGFEAVGSHGTTRLGPPAFRHRGPIPLAFSSSEASVSYDRRMLHSGVEVCTCRCQTRFHCSCPCLIFKPESYHRIR